MDTTSRCVYTHDLAMRFNIAFCDLCPPVYAVRWLSVDRHFVDCHLGRAPLNCHLHHIVINVDTFVDCLYVALYLIPS